MRREVAVAEAEPRLLAVALEHLRGRERLAREAPAPLAIVDAGERVHDRVVVRRDEQPVALDVVRRVDDDDEPAPEVRLKPVRESRAADAAGEERRLEGVSSCPHHTSRRGSRSLARPGPRRPRHGDRTRRASCQPAPRTAALRRRHHRRAVPLARSAARLARRRRRGHQVDWRVGRPKRSRRRRNGRAAAAGTGRSASRGSMELPAGATSIQRHDHAGRGPGTTAARWLHRRQRLPIRRHGSGWQDRHPEGARVRFGRPPAGGSDPGRRNDRALRRGRLAPAWHHAGSRFGVCHVVTEFGDFAVVARGVSPYPTDDASTAPATGDLPIPIADHGSVDAGTPGPSLSDQATQPGDTAAGPILVAAGVIAVAALVIAVGVPASAAPGPSWSDRLEPLIAVRALGYCDSVSITC